MREVQLGDSGVVTTALGFGCGQLLRVSSARERERLLGAAFDAGVRHFDVARSYGLGGAEAELGRFARGRRDQLVVATKFGIAVDARAGRLRAVQGIARRVLAAVPALRSAVRARGGALLAPRCYDAATARASLETSLRELGTDYVDLFLLHEPTLEAVENADVLEFLEAARREGKIRAFGIAGLASDALRIDHALPAFTRVLQIPSNAIERNAERIEARRDQGVVTFSVLSGALDAITRHAGRDEATRRRWRDAVGVDCASRDALAPLLLQCGLTANPAGVVLFSTTRPARVPALATAADAGEGASAAHALIARVEREWAREEQS
jgi:aryl-alcohol dehydrogenase-like predicted oxidoreductase